MCWNFFLILSIAKFLRAPILKSICERLLLKMFSWNWEKLKFLHKVLFLNLTIKKVFSTSISKQVSMFVFISWLVSFEVCFYIQQYFFGVVRNKLQTLNIKIKRRSKVQEKNISCERPLNFDQPKTFSENYEPMRVWLWLVYKFTKNYCRSRFFSKFIFKLKTGILPLLTKYVS